MKINNNDSTNDRRLGRSIPLLENLPGASANNCNNSDNVTISRNNRRNNLSDDPIPTHVFNLICSVDQKHKKNKPTSLTYCVKSTPPSSCLYAQNLNQYSLELMITLFQCYGIIRQCENIDEINVLVRFQTLAMAVKAKTSIVEEFKKYNVDFPIVYGIMMPTPRIWIGGMFPNTTEKEVIAELACVPHIVNITWYRNFKEAEAYILYQHQDFAQKSVNNIFQRGCILRSSQCPIQVGYTDICSFPFQHKNCQITTEISDKCLTEIPAKFIINSTSTSATLHFIAGDCSIAERLLFQHDFQLHITTISKNFNIKLDDLLFYCNSIFLGIFTPNQEESSNKIVAYLTEKASVGFSNTIIKDETFVSAILPPSHFSTYIMKYYFEDFLPNDERNQSYVVVIVLRKPTPMSKLP